MLRKSGGGFVPFPVSPWLLKTTINASGRVISGTSSSKYMATSEDYYAVNQTTFLYTGATKDANDVPFNSYIHEYSGDTWLRRTALLSQETAVEVTTGADCDRVRICFARSSASGVTMTQADINEYFALSYKEA